MAGTGRVYRIPPMELLQGGITLTDLARHVLLRLGVRTTDTANG